MYSHFYAVKCLTNMHMGSGDTNFNIVDNEVQKDPITLFPTMHASGIKGALRDYFRGNGKPSDEIERIFGSERLDNLALNMQQTKPGLLKFLSAQLICIPVRSADNKSPYYIATSMELLKRFGELFLSVTGNDVTSNFMDKVKALDENKAYYWRDGQIKIEDFAFNISTSDDIEKPIRLFTRKFYPDDYDQCKLVIMPDKALQAIHLPVLARNQLNNGISNNLWYEEVVPHGAVFAFGVLSENTPTGIKTLAAFHDAVTNQLIQFGGNASVGCGLTKIIALA